MTEDAPGVTVEELASRAGTTVRTIREYQTWHVLPPPTRVGRRGYYDESHLRRLEAIARLQGRGYSIAAIRDLFAAWEHGAGLRDVLGVDGVTALDADEAPVALTREQVGVLAPPLLTDPDLLARAVGARVVLADGDGFVARSPALLQLLTDLLAAGTAPDEAIGLIETMTAAADQVGGAVAHAVADAVDRGVPVDDLVRRGRFLLARAVASHTVDRVGHHLGLLASDRPGLRAVVDDVRIGSIPHPTTIEGAEP